jgi:gliding motility-associated-like protein
MPKNLLGILLFFTGSCGLLAQSDSSRQAIIPHVSPSLRFTENKGQWESNILFRAQLDGGALFLENNSLTFSFYDKKKYRALHHGGILKSQYKDLLIKGHAYKIRFEGANPVPSVEKLQQGSDYENFFIGNDQNRWQGHVRNYHQVWLRNLYRDIDYEVITATNGIKYNFHVKANANPSDIQLRYEGVDKIKLKDGALYFKLEVNEVIEQKPYAYQLINGRVKEVKCLYRFKDNVLGFEFPNGYNKNYELVIDPVLVFAAQSGSAADNFGMTATFDSDGNLYAGGTAFNNGYPTTAGAFSLSFSGAPNVSTDVVITKYNATGTGLLYSTYVGGTGAEIVTSLIVDHSNNLCFYGATGSSNFPVTNGAYDVSYNGGQAMSFYYNGTNFTTGTDIYVGKLNSTGSTMMGCTFLGGTSNDGVNHVNHLSVLSTPSGTVMEYVVDSLQFNYGDQYRGEIQVDASNNIYIASSTRSSDFPTVNAADATLGGKQDAIVAKFNSALTQLLYCTFIGGSLNDCGNSLIVNNNFEVYLGGGTCSSDFPTTASNSQTYNGGKTDGYIVHLNSAGNSIIQATYVGTGSYDQVYFIQSDRNYNNIYVYGQSLGNMTIFGIPTPFGNPGTHQFIRKYDNTLGVMNMSTVFGNNQSGIDISPSAFAVDKCDNIYLSGWGGAIVPPVTTISNMPLASATQSTTDGNDFYLMGLSPNAGSLLYGSYFGGIFSDEHVDGGTSRFDPLGKIYQSVCAGCGGNDDFPVTPGAWPNTPGNPNHNSNCNNGVFKLNFQLIVAVSTINTNTVAGCVPLTISFTNATAPTGAGSTYTWNFGNGIVTSSSLNPVHTFTASGVYTISLIVQDPTSCNLQDESISYITVHPTPTVNFSFTTTPCTNTIITGNSSVGNFGSSPFSWNFGNSVISTQTAPPYTYPADGNYVITLTVKDINGCTDVMSKPLSIFNFTPAVVTPSICYGAAVTVTASGGNSYTWSPAASLSASNVAAPVAQPTASTVYTVVVNYNAPGFACSDTVTSQLQVQPKPNADFTFSINPCGGGVYFTDMSTANITSWDWILSPAATRTIQNPYYFYTGGGNFSVRLITTNNFGCKDTVYKPIAVPIPPPLKINNDTAVCKGGSVRLSASGGIAYSWTPVNSLDIPMLSSPNASPLVNTEYSVVITTSNSVNGQPCTFLLTTLVTVEPLSTVPVSAQANPAVIITGNASTLVYLGDPGALVTWYPLGSTRPQTGYTVTASPNMPTTYTAVAKHGPCSERAAVHVDAYTEGCIDKDVFVPNTFTPNNDGQNDLFMARGLKIQDIYFAVYNRWGERVFETTDKTQGWDGVYKGKPADVGVFGWYLTVKCFNGEETFRKGNVTLIR